MTFNHQNIGSNPIGPKIIPKIPILKYNQELVVDYNMKSLDFSLADCIYI